MIRLEKITKTFRTRTGKHTVFRNLNLEIQTGAGVAILGRNGVGKTTLIRIIAGAEASDSGRVITDASISWPVGLSGGFQPSLTARENVKFVARPYAERSQIKKIVDFVRSFAEIGEYLDMPTRTYSSGMQSRVSFGLSMAFDFDYYLIDEITAVGDAQFRLKCEVALAEKRANRAGFIVVSHQMDIVRKFCDSAVVLTHEGARHYADLEEAIRAYQSNG